MAGAFAYQCECCGEIHEGAPSFGFDAPDYYAHLTEEQKESYGWITDDLCKVTFEGHTDYFIRAILEVPIHGVTEPFLWGVWVSASQQSYDRYVETFDAPAAGDGFFGWVSNAIPWYPEAGNLAANVYVQPDGNRPIVRLHSGGEDDHPLIRDQEAGISMAKAQEVAEFVMHRH